MKLNRVRQFYGDAVDAVTTYLSQDLWQTLVDIQRVLGQINFDDNFQGWIERDLVIPSGESVSIPNRLKPDVPRYRVILRATQSRISDGTVSWDERNVYLRNDDSSDAIVTVAFLK